MPHSYYDKATEIMRASFPARAKATEIMSTVFPGLALADRVMADAGFFPRGGRGGRTAGTSGGLVGESSPGVIGRWRDGGRPVRTGPHYRRGGRSSVADLIAQDVRRAGQSGGPVVDIRVWAAKLQEAGVSQEVIAGGYEDAGGDAVLSAAQQQGNTDTFLADFVEAMQELGASPEVLVGTYQSAGGRIGG